MDDLEQRSEAEAIIEVPTKQQVRQETSFWNREVNGENAAYGFIIGLGVYVAAFLNMAAHYKRKTKPDFRLREIFFTVFDA